MIITDCQSCKNLKNNKCTLGKECFENNRIFTPGFCRNYTKENDNYSLKFDYTLIYRYNKESIDKLRSIVNKDCVFYSSEKIILCANNDELDRFLIKKLVKNYSKLIINININKEKNEIDYHLRNVLNKVKTPFFILYPNGFPKIDQDNFIQNTRKKIEKNIDSILFWQFSDVFGIYPTEMIKKLPYKLCDIISIIKETEKQFNVKLIEKL